MRPIKLKYISKWVYDLSFCNGNDLGSFEMADDGYFYYEFPVNTCGFVGAWHLREIANLLEELNEPWDKIIEQQMNKQNRRLFTCCSYELTEFPFC